MPQNQENFNNAITELEELEASFAAQEEKAEEAELEEKSDAVDEVGDPRVEVGTADDEPVEGDDPDAEADAVEASEEVAAEAAEAAAESEIPAKEEEEKSEEDATEEKAEEEDTEEKSEESEEVKEKADYVEGDDEEEDDEEEETPVEAPAPTDDEEEEDEEEEKSEAPESEEVKGGRVVLVGRIMDDEDEEDGKEQNPVEASSQEPEEEDEEMMMRKRRRAMRLMAMGYKEEDLEGIADNATLCAVERKMLPNDEPCAFCRGGCASEKGLPGLLDIEAEAMASFKGEVLDSGYAPNEDIFVVDLKTEDGRTIEAFYSGEGKAAGWILLNQDLVDEANLEGKDALAGQKTIGIEDAEEIAIKSIDGVAVGVEASIFEGYDAWVVQVEGVDGKSYDAYVGLDGTLLGYDEFAMEEFASDLSEEEIEEVKTLEAELHFKREFSQDRRESLAKQGHALPDGSFPIVNAEDLKNAIQAYGRAKNKKLAKEHIIKRAAQLGQESLLPDDWKGEKVANEENFYKSLAEFEEIQLELDELNES